SMLVTEGIQRMRFRHGTSKEDFIKPGEICSITIRLTNSAITFRKGHKVRVLISSSDYPKYAPNRNDGGPVYGEEARGGGANNSVYYDAPHPSAVLRRAGGRWEAIGQRPPQDVPRKRPTAAGAPIAAGSGVPPPHARQSNI